MIQASPPHFITLALLTFIELLPYLEEKLSTDTSDLYDSLVFLLAKANDAATPGAGMARFIRKVLLLRYPEKFDATPAEPSVRLDGQGNYRLGVDRFLCRPDIHFFLDSQPPTAVISEREIWDMITNLPTSQDLHTQDELGRTALHIACARNFGVAARALFRRCPTAADLTDCHGRLPLHWAAVTGCESFIEEVEIAPSFNCSVHATDSAGETPLSLAASTYARVKNHTNKMGYLEALHRMSLVEQYCDCKNRTGWTLMHHAAAGGHTEAVKALVSSTSLYLHHCSSLGSTPLSLAIENGHMEVVHLLASKEVRVIGIEDGQDGPVLDSALENEYPVIASRLKHTDVPGAVATPWRSHDAGPRAKPLFYGENNLPNDALKRQHKEFSRSIRSVSSANRRRRHGAGPPAKTLSSDENNSANDALEQRLGKSSISIRTVSSANSQRNHGAGPLARLLSNDENNSANDTLKQRLWESSLSSLSIRTGSSTTSQRRHGAGLLARLLSRASSPASHISARLSRAHLSPSSNRSVVSFSSVQQLESDYLRDYRCCNQALPTLGALIEHQLAHHPEHWDRSVDVRNNGWWVKEKNIEQSDIWE